MATKGLFSAPQAQVLNIAASAGAGARLYFTAAGGVVYKPVFTTSAYTTPVSTGGDGFGTYVAADAEGRFPPCWLDGVYRVVARDGGGAVLYDVDNVTGVASDASIADSVNTAIQNALISGDSFVESKAIPALVNIGTFAVPASYIEDFTVGRRVRVHGNTLSPNPLYASIASVTITGANINVGLLSTSNLVGTLTKVALGTRAEDKNYLWERLWLDLSTPQDGRSTTPATPVERSGELFYRDSTAGITYQTVGNIINESHLAGAQGMGVFLRLGNWQVGNNFRPAGIGVYNGEFSIYASYVDNATLARAAIFYVPASGIAVIAPSSNELLEIGQSNNRVVRVHAVEYYAKSALNPAITQKVVGARNTGWTAGTGVANKGAFDTTTATTSDVAQRMLAVEQALTSHGLIGVS